MRGDLGILLGGLLLLSPACTVHSALQPDQRLVRLDERGAAPRVAGEDEAAEPWRPATPDDLVGSFTSVQIRGVAAASVLQMSYHFDRNGHYTGSALISSPKGPRHQIISGDWQLRAGRLSLGHGSPPAPARVRGRRLELSSDLGTVLLARRE